MKELNHTIHGIQIILLGGITLYELTRHSDHHFKSSKKYQVLESIEDSPQLPYGYPTSILISFFPPLWFRIMNPLVEHHMGYSN
jgi:alkane 1-monooxygenase